MWAQSQRNLGDSQILQNFLLKPEGENQNKVLALYKRRIVIAMVNWQAMIHSRFLKLKVPIDTQIWKVMFIITLDGAAIYWAEYQLRKIFKFCWDQGPVLIAKWRGNSNFEEAEKQNFGF